MLDVMVFLYNFRTISVSMQLYWLLFSTLLLQIASLLHPTIDRGVQLNQFEDLTNTVEQICLYDKTTDVCLWYLIIYYRYHMSSTL